MRLTKIDEIKEMHDDDVVKAFSGQVRKVFKMHSGKKRSGDGEYTLQTIVVGDPKNDDEIKVTFKDRMEEIPLNWRGRTILIESADLSGRYSGVKVKEEDWENKDGKRIEEVVLWVTPSAIVGFLDEDEEERPSRSKRRSRDDDDEDDQPKRKRMSNPPREDDPPPTRKRGKSSVDESDAEEDAKAQYVTTKVKLSKIANLWIICSEAAEYCKEAYEKRHGREMPEALYDSCLGQIFAETKVRGMIEGVPLVDLREQFLPNADKDESSSQDSPEDEEEEESEEEEAANEFDDED